MPKDNLSITVFGDSIGKGIVTDGGRPEVMDENAVRLFERESGVTVDNRSAFGQSLMRLCNKKGIDRYLCSVDRSRRNVAVIELGGNDADFNWREVGSDPCSSHGPLTDPDDFSRCYADAVVRLKEAGVEVVACTLVPVSSERYFNNVISKIADKCGVLKFFKGDVNTIHRHQEMFNNEVIKNAYRFGLGIIDIRRRFLDSNDFDNMMCLDGIHPNAAGQREIYASVKEFVSGYRN